MIYSLLMLVGLTLQIIFIVQERKKRYVKAVVLKGLASLMFVIIGILATVNAQDKKFAGLVLAGLVLGMVGDVLLNLRFVLKNSKSVFLAGIAAFLAGHVLYLCALIPGCESLTVCLIAGAVAAALLLLWIFSKITAQPAFKIFGVFYIGAIVLMTAVAIGNLVAEPTLIRNLCYAIGAVFFTISDVILIFNTFGKKSKFSMRVSNLLFYYAGQILIAFSTLFV